MRPHRTDGISLSFGLLFLLVAIWWAIAQVVTVRLPAAGWLVAAALILFGTIGLLGAIRSGRRTEVPATVQAEAQVETPGDLPPQMHAEIVRELLDNPADRVDLHPAYLQHPVPAPAPTSGPPAATPTTTPPPPAPAAASPARSSPAAASPAPSGFGGAGSAGEPTAVVRPAAETTDPVGDDPAAAGREEEVGEQPTAVMVAAGEAGDKSTAEVTRVDLGQGNGPNRAPAGGRDDD